jgi:hypothetical protein
VSDELLLRAQSEIEPVLGDPREGDETEVVEKGDEGGETKRTQTVLSASGPRDGDETETVPESPAESKLRNDAEASDPREGDETETTERGGGSKRHVLPFQEGPRDGDDTTPIRESPLGPPVRV